MANVINCPNCNRALRVPDDLLGQSVQCPSCQTTFTASLPASSERQPPPSQEDEDESPPPRRSRDDDDRPRRRRRDEDDDDDRPSRRSRRLAPHRGDMIQILGILAFIPVLGLPFILGPIAWIMGNGDLREMNAGRMDPSGRKATETGRLCGKLAVIIWGSLVGGVLLIYLSCCCCGMAGSVGGHR
jgi:predicted Zn finger-like uncharacterized protein